MVNSKVLQCFFFISWFLFGFANSWNIFYPDFFLSLVVLLGTILFLPTFFYSRVDFFLFSLDDNKIYILGMNINFIWQGVNRGLKRWHPPDVTSWFSLSLSFSMNGYEMELQTWLQNNVFTVYSVFLLGVHKTYTYIHLKLFISISLGSYICKW